MALALRWQHILFLHTDIHTYMHTYIRHPEKDGTCLSKYIHKLTRQGIGYTLKWEILKKAPPWNPITNICRLCILEKHHILFHPEDSSLNQRSEFFTVCKHQEKHLLMKTWTASFLKIFFTNYTSTFPFICSSQKKFQIKFTFTFPFLFNILHFCIYMYLLCLSIYAIFLKWANLVKPVEKCLQVIRNINVQAEKLK